MCIFVHMCTGAYVHVEYPVLVKTQTVKGEGKQKINRKEEKVRERKKIPCAKYHVQRLSNSFNFASKTVNNFS